LTIGSTQQHTGIKYALTALAKEKGSIAKELAAVGFEAGETFTRQVLDLKDLPAKEVPKSFINGFTIETYWGRWCPTASWETLRSTFSGSKEFISQFQSSTTDDKLQRIKKDAADIQQRLIDQGLIQPVKDDHLDRWCDRIIQLRSNTPRLDRFFTGYEAHPLPYTIEQKTEIEELFDSLQDAIELSGKTNKAKQKVETALKQADPDLLQINARER